MKSIWGSLDLYLNFSVSLKYQNKKVQEGEEEEEEQEGKKKNIGRIPYRLNGFGDEPEV